MGVRCCFFILDVGLELVFDMIELLGFFENELLDEMWFFVFCVDGVFCFNVVGLDLVYLI